MHGPESDEVSSESHKLGCMHDFWGEPSTYLYTEILESTQNGFFGLLLGGPAKAGFFS